MDENLTTGSRTQLEYLIVSQILRHFIRLSIDDPGLNQTHAVYCACVELSRAMDLLGINQKPKCTSCSKSTKKYFYNII